jgi:hypothetical protein
MKHIFNLALSGAVALSIGCQQEPDNGGADDYYLGTATVTINDELFTFKANVSKAFEIDSAFNLYCVLQDEYGQLRKSISCSVFNLSAGKQPINSVLEFPRRFPSSGYGTLLSDGDVVGSYYELNVTDSIADYIQITSYNAQTRQIKGILRGSYMVSHIDYDPAAPDSVVVNCVFETVIAE